MARRADPLQFLKTDFLQELERIDGPLSKVIFDLKDVLFGPQYDFVTDDSSFADACCSRRAGKSIGIAGWLLEGPLKEGSPPSLYITRTRLTAKRIIWGPMLRMNKTYNLGYDPNETELTLKKDGEPLVYIVGIDNKAEIEKIRGTGWGRIAIDEAQSLPAYIEDLIDDILMPSLMDHDGKIRLIGTPGPVPVGFFYKATQSKEWSHHHWTVWDNPHVKHAKKILDKVLSARGVNLEDPSIQREWFGKWAHDPNALVFRFDSQKNFFTELPKCSTPWQYIMGVDLGFEDADAIAVLAFNEESPNAYVVEEWAGEKQSITGLTEKIRDYIKKYNPQSIVWDTGGLGKKIADEVTTRTGIPMRAAEKHRKFEFIALLNDALRTEKLFVRRSSRFAHDAMLLEWDRDKSTNDKPVISDRFHSDIGDAVLYAYRESYHWLHEPKHARPKVGTPEWFAEEEARLIRHAQLQQDREDDPWT